VPGLVSRCRAGDRDAWAQVVADHARLVNGILRGAYGLSAHDAEDAFQEVFTRLYLNLTDLREERALPGWVAQVARHVAIDVIRRNQREVSSELELADDGYDESYEHVVESMALRHALSRLPDQQREMLERFFVQDQSYRAIAEELAIPAGTIASRISRALALLGEEFMEESGALARL
jgi:RNA polymerase sigma factor (sigma-70 family)